MFFVDQATLVLTKFQRALHGLNTSVYVRRTKVGLRPICNKMRSISFQFNHWTSYAEKLRMDIGSSERARKLFERVIDIVTNDIVQGRPNSVLHTPPHRDTPADPCPISMCIYLGMHGYNFVFYKIYVYPFLF